MCGGAKPPKAQPIPKTPEIAKRPAKGAIDSKDDARKQAIKASGLSGTNKTLGLLTATGYGKKDKLG